MMIRVAGVLALVVGLYLLLAARNPNAMKESNLIDVANRQGAAAVITLGVAVLIIAGGIDLSIGSVVGLSAIGFGLLMKQQVPPVIAFFIVMAGGACIGLLHGLLVTRLKLQAFLVTLCGMFIYRGLARYLSDGKPVGLVSIKNEFPDTESGINFLRHYLIGKDFDGLLLFPGMLVVALVITVFLGLILHKTTIGRYWYAVGYNESAARFSGIRTDRMRIFAFMICSACAALAGMLDILNQNDANPSITGSELELYAITGAVLGGCSLRGGEGTIIGALLGASVLPLLKNLLSFEQIPDAIIPAVIGVTLLLGTIVDETIRRRAARRK
ncbi:MAG: ABC transporter permease [Zavarzinella sp.]